MQQYLYIKKQTKKKKKKNEGYVLINITDANNNHWHLLE